ncbi:MAG TPA: SurA N-terminal domain-containing protein [Candidatus Binatia bacterium]|jgi:peptidyl-prolyl cis-trans isomerase D
MLDILRKRKRSWVVTLLLGLIVVVFVLFYGGRAMREGETEKIAEVNGETISQREFGAYYQKVMDFYRNLLKGDLTPETMKNLKLKGKVMEDLIQRHLLLQEARRLGLEVTDEELADAIARAPEFQIEGRFSKNHYLQLLRANRLEPTQFEEERRDDLAVQKLFDIIQDAVHVSENEARERYQFAQEKVSFSFIRLSADDFLPQAGVTEQEIKDYYDRNKAALADPLKVQVEYVIYPFAQFAAKVQPSEKEIEEYYNRNRATRFQQPRAVRARHILVRVPSGGDAAQKGGARAKAEAALKEARGGKDFAELAKKYSDDPGASQGGDLGWVNPKQFVAVLDQALFALKKGEVGAVVESPLGYHIFKVEDVRPEKTASLKDAMPEIMRALKGERGKVEAARAADADRGKALSGAELSALAKERGLAAKMTPLFGAGEVFPEIAPMEEFKRAAFSLAVKEVSPAIEGPNGYYVLRVAQKKEPAVPPLDVLRGEVESRVKRAKALDLANKKAQAVLDQLNQEKDIDKVARANGLQVGDTGWFARGDGEIPKVGALQDVRPGGIAISAYKPIADRPYAQKDGIYLFAFKSSQGPDMSRFEKEKRGLMEQALQEKKQAVMKQFVDDLKAKSRIEVEPRVLEES